MIMRYINSLLTLTLTLTIGSEFQAAGPETAKLHDPYRDSQQCGILRSRREHEFRRDQPLVIDTGMHMSVRYDGVLCR